MTRSGVRWEKAKALAAGEGTEGAEVALVERQDVARAVTLGQDDDGGVGEAELVNARRKLFEKDDLTVHSGELDEKIINFSGNKWRQDSRRLGMRQRLHAFGVMRLMG